MTEVNPPGFLQTAGIKHPAKLYRRSFAGIIGQGVAGFTANDLQVTAGPGSYQVNVARGGGYVKGTDTQDQGIYPVYNDATVNITLNNPDGTNDRIDVIIAHVQDNTEGQAGDNWLLDKVTGTPSGSPAVPSLPNSAMDIAHVLVRHGAGSILNSDITDTRVLAPIVTASGIPNCRVNKSSADQLIATGPPDHPVTWDTKEFDTDGFYSVGAQDRLTIPSGKAGIYLITVGVTFEECADSSHTGQRRNIKIWKNGVSGTLLRENQMAVQPSVFSLSYQPVFEATTLAKFIVGDYITVSAFQDSGVDRHILSSVGQTNLQIAKIG